MDDDLAPMTDADPAAVLARDDETSFVPPSVHPDALWAGKSYTHFSPVPPALLLAENENNPPCCLGVDEAGRGPVLGPMVYGIFYLPLALADPLLRAQHRFDDSKVLTPGVRAALMRTLCTPPSPSDGGTEPSLYTHCGWATTALSAQAIAAGMLRPGAAYNLNAQAMDATVALVRGALARGVNVAEIYVDTVGPPAAYQQKLERIFPGINITVAKKADSLYPCVSAASVCAKVTRDACLEVLHRRRRRVAVGPHQQEKEEKDDEGGMAWGSGYPSDARCISWLRSNMHPVFGWGPECRFSWGTAKDMIEAKGAGVKVEWPVDDDGETSHLTDYFGGSNDRENDGDELGTWFGSPAGLEAF